MFTRQTFVDYTTPAVSAAWLNGMQTKIDEVTSLRDFDVAGDGVTDDTAGIQAFLDYLADNGGYGFIPIGTYMFTSALVLTNPANGFVLSGAGNGSVLMQRTLTDVTALSIVAPHDTLMQNFRIDCGYSVTGHASHGISMRNAQNVTVNNVYVYEHLNAAMLTFVNTQDTYGNCHFINCTSDSQGYGNNGFLHEGMLHSSIQNCRVLALDPAGSPCAGLQLKNLCKFSYILGGYAEECKGGAVMGGDGSGAGEGPFNCYIRGVTTKDCWDGILVGKTTDCFIEAQVDQSASPAPSGVAGYAVNVAGFNQNLSIEARIYNVQAGRTSIRIGSDDTSIWVPYINGYGDYIATLTAGVNRARIIIGDIAGTTSININDLVSDSSGTSDNTILYLQDLPNQGLGGGDPILFFKTVGKSQNWIVYDDSLDTYRFRANGSDILQFSTTDMQPNVDNVMAMGTLAKRWSGVGAGYMNLVDGISAPSASLGNAIIYVDSADGDLKVKFGDGTVKTLATDT